MSYSTARSKQSSCEPSLARKLGTGRSVHAEGGGEGCGEGGGGRKGGGWIGGSGDGEGNSGDGAGSGDSKGGSMKGDSGCVDLLGGAESSADSGEGGCGCGCGSDGGGAAADSASVCRQPPQAHVVGHAAVIPVPNCACSQ